MSLWSRIRDTFAPDAPRTRQGRRRRRRQARRGLLRRFVDAVTGATETTDIEREPREPPRFRGGDYEPEPDYDAEPREAEPDSIEAAMIGLGIDADIAADFAPVIADVLGPYV